MDQTTPLPRLIMEGVLASMGPAEWTADDCRDFTTHMIGSLFERGFLIVPVGEADTICAAAKPVARPWGGGGWVCTSHDCWGGYGATPMAAYCDLMSILEKVRAKLP